MVKKKVALLEFDKDTNIANYMVLFDDFAFCSKILDYSKKKEIENTIGCEIIYLTILNTFSIGSFICCDKNKLIVSSNIFENEKEILKKTCKKFKIELKFYNFLENAFGNNMCLFDKNSIIVSKNFKKKEIDILKKDFDKVVVLEDENYNLAGSLIKNLGNNNNEIFISQELNEKDYKKIKKFVVGSGTAGFGNNFISSSILSNNNSILLSSNSTTVEIQNIIDCFDKN